MSDIDTFTIGDTLTLSQGDRTLDDVRVLGFDKATRPTRNGVLHELRVESLRLKPGAKTTFLYVESEFANGWRLLESDMLTGAPCFSSRSTPFRFRPSSWSPSLVGDASDEGFRLDTPLV